MPDRSPGDDVGQIASLPRVAIQAFCETLEVAEAIEQASQDRRMEKAHVKVQMGGAAAAVEAYRSAPTPNVIMIESDAKREELIEHLERLSEVCDSGTKVIILGRLNDVLLYRDLIRRGISEYLVAPVAPIELVRALSELFRAPDAEPVGRVISFIGAKGGVGSSTLAHNTAWAISKTLGIEGVIVDLDMPFGTAGLDFNQDPPQGIAEAVFSPERLDQNFVDRLLSKCADKLSLLAAPSTLDRIYDFPDDAFDGLIEILRTNVPAVVLDVPHGWNGWTKRVLASSDEIVVCAAPDLANLRNAKNIIDLMKQQRPHDAAPRLVLNQTNVPKRQEIKPSDFASAVEVEPLAAISFDPQLFGTAANNGQMISETNAKHPAAQQFVDLARALTGRAESRASKQGMLTPLLARLAPKKRKAS